MNKLRLTIYVLSRYFSGFRKVMVVLAICMLTGLPALSMDFDWWIFKGKKIQLRMHGEIKRGDYEKFRLFMIDNLDNYSSTSKSVSVSSNGGDLVEALKIAKILKRMYPSVVVDPEGMCASACFFLYLSGADRWPVKKNNLGIHRAYFDPGYFAGLSLPLAEKKQKELTNLVNSVLEDYSVPRSLIELMNRTSSGEIHWLTQLELEQIQGRAAWYEELLIAKCKYDKALETRFNGMSRDSPAFDRVAEAYMTNLRLWAACEEKMVSLELKGLPELLRKH